MKHVEDLIKEHAFFRSFPVAYANLIAGCGKNVHFKAGVFMAHEGASADTFYVIRKGLVSIEIHSPVRGAHRIETLHDGEIVGWSWIFPPYKWNFDLKAQDEVSAIAIDGKCLRQKCENDHSLGFFLMQQFAKIMAHRLKTTRLQLLDIYGHESPNAK